ncbi:alpha-mannosidase [Granulosicoccus antarcticus]|uniref:Mannosylglycerate hydrolase n=1 Tax=Granulosicoccus antarcticus IMCC3135 TaxID=1192854 RepID=A0A2Z2NL76_9GAMM|nr:alpha-mannosidase [Granulosicoccus antarcticus]ASJ70741.1 Mannosylglycerate hydrolase [Granulosicoccus antarcticus IMCC3135]
MNRQTADMSHETPHDLANAKPAPRFDRIFMVGHAHLDPVWLWRWTEGYQEARATVHAAIKLLAEDKNYVFTLEQMAVLDWVRESEPQLFEQVQRYVEQGRISLVGGWWIEPDCNLPALESFVRQGLLGQRFMLRHFGHIASLGLNADPFGHSAALPQVLRQQRIDSYCFLRPGPTETDMPYTWFDWLGIDGTSVQAYRIPHEYCCGGEDIASHMQSAVETVAPTTLGDAMVFFGVGNHGGGPTRRNLQSLHSLNESGRFGELIPAGPERFFEEVRSSGLVPPRWHGELQRHAAGCYSAHSEIKRINLRGELRLLEAERFATIVHRLHGIAYPTDEFDSAWKTLLFNQFHDILPGSAIETAYDDARHQLGGVIATADKATNLALQSIARSIHIPLDEATQPLLVFNPHPFAIKTMVEIELAFTTGSWSLADEAGKQLSWQQIQPMATMRENDSFRNLYRRRILFEAQVPALGHQLYRLEVDKQSPPTLAAAAVTACGTTLENSCLRVTIDPNTGWVSELVLKDRQVNFAPASGCAHTVVTDDQSDTWGHRVESYAQPGSSFVVDSLTIVECGPIRAAIRVDSSWGTSRLSEVYSITADSDVIDLEVSLDWREQRKLLKLRFPSAIKTDQMLYQIQTGSIMRPADGNENPGQRWISVCDKHAPEQSRLTVINDAKYAYDCCGGDMGITIARSPVYAWHDPETLAPDRLYSHQDQGIQRFTCRIVPQLDGGDLNVVEQLTAELCTPLRIMMESFHEGEINTSRGLIDGLDEAAGVMVSAIKPWEEDPSHTLIRLVNHSNITCRKELVLGFLNNRPLSVELEALQIKSWVIPPQDDVAPFEVDLLEFRPDHPLPRAVPRDS